MLPPAGAPCFICADGSSFAQMARPGGSREAMAFGVGDHHHGRRIGSGIHPGPEVGIGSHFDHEGVELSFGHGTIPMGHLHA